MQQTRLVFSFLDVKSHAALARCGARFRSAGSHATAWSPTLTLDVPDTASVRWMEALPAA